MRFNVLYLARLREAFGRRHEEIELPGEGTVGQLIDALRARGGPWATELAAGRAVRVAVIQEMTTLSASLADGDEVALFPPVTGG
jgi:molybdopterin synthase sulfur carrier subunit